MTIEDELEPKLGLIRRRAKEMYALYLGSMGLKFDDESGLIVYDDESLAVTDRVDLEHERVKWRGVYNDVNELCARFQRFYGLDPLDLTILTGSLGGLPRTDTVVPAGGTSVPVRLDHAWDPWVVRVDGLINERYWEGDAATTFHTGFLFQFEDSVQQQMAYSGILAAVAHTYHDTLRDGLKDLTQIADLCADRLGGGGDGDAGATYTVAGIVAGVASLFPPVSTAMTLVGLGISIASVLDDGGSGVTEGAAIPIHITGINVQSIIESTWDAITSLTDYFAHADETLSDRLGRYLQSPRCFDSPGLEVHRPAVADGNDAFAALKPGNNVVAEVVSLYRAGYVNLPAAANQYELAKTRLDECTLPAKLSTLFPRSEPRFDAARDNLSGILGRTRDNLTDAGTALVAAATSYHMCDEDNAEKLRQFREIDPPSTGAYTLPMHHVL